MLFYKSYTNDKTYEFDIKYNCRTKFKNSENYKEFIKVYTTIPENEIKVMEQFDAGEIYKIIQSKINFDDTNVLLNQIALCVERINTDIRFSMILMLNNLNQNYKLEHLYEWDYKKLFEVFCLEMCRNKNVRDIFVNNLNAFYKNEKISSTIKEMFPDNIYNKNEKPSDEDNEALIEKLSRL